MYKKHLYFIFDLMTTHLLFTPIQKNIFFSQAILYKKYRLLNMVFIKKTIQLNRICPIYYWLINALWLLSA